jgi:hypothetical protein
MILFNGRRRIDANQVACIKAWVRAHWDLPEETTVMVTELECREPGCPPIETVIAVLEGPGKTRQYKIHKTAAEVIRQDVETLANSSEGTGTEKNRCQEEETMLMENATDGSSRKDRPTLVDDPAARVLVRDAHHRMYKWPVGFVGYRADVTLNDEGRILKGAVRLMPRKDTVIDLAGADPAIQEWVRDRLWTQGMHLAHTTFDEGDGRYVLSFDPEEDPARLHPRGRRVLLTGGRLASWYRIKDHRYMQIGRITPMTEHRVNTIERYDLAPDGRQYSSHYVMTYFTLDGKSVVGMESYVNEFSDVQGVWLPLRRRISCGEQGFVKTRIIELSNHEVLS